MGGPIYCDGQLKSSGPGSYFGHNYRSRSSECLQVLPVVTCSHPPLFRYEIGVRSSHSLPNRNPSTTCRAYRNNHGLDAFPIMSTFCECF